MSRASCARLPPVTQTERARGANWRQTKREDAPAAGCVLCAGIRSETIRASAWRCCDQLAREKREAKEAAERAAVTYEEKHTTPRADLVPNWAGNGQPESEFREQIRQRVIEEDEERLRRLAAVSRNGIIDPRAGSFTARMAARSDAKEFGEGGSVGRGGAVAEEEGEGNGRCL